MKKIAIAGYHFSGCGVIDDLFREFDNVAQPKSEHESRYLQDMDGVSDLEYHLVDAPNRLTTSWAIDRFLNYCKKKEEGYRLIYGQNWYKMCQEYVDSLIKFRFQGFNIAILNERSKKYSRYIKLMWYLQRFKPSKYRHSFSYNYFPNESLIHSSLSEEEFLVKTRAFTERLAESMVTNKKAEYVMIDQMFAANNPDRYLRYVDDVKAFVVDRDPRDLYINMMNREDHALPTDVHQFCEYFRDIRKNKNANNPSVMYLMIEDMIYHYDELLPQICCFVGIDQTHHIDKKKYFDPAISVRGTRTWERYSQYSEAVKVIEQELSEFLYVNY